ncbi:MAG TPA: glycosyltransferase family 9 protein [Holophaga sp.]|nr:glycosyltransferase family 9 protein [Holophaga sp.]
MDAVPGGAIWVRFPRYIGDGIMIHRALEPLRAAGHILVAWGPPPVMELFQGTACYGATVPDPPERPGAWAMAKILRAHSCTGVISLARSQRAAFAALLGRIPLRIGWREGGGALLCSHALAFKTLGGHQQDRYARLLRKAFPDLPDAPFVPFRPREAARAEAERLLAGLPGPFVALALGAASPAKRVAPAVWKELCGLLLAQGRSIVLLGAGREDEACAAAVRAGVPGALDLTGKASLSVAAEVIRASEGLVGNDSALCHLAAACGMPTVVAFGPTAAGVTIPQGAWVRAVHAPGVPCLGCLRQVCPLPAHPCMNDLRAADLAAALEDARPARS